MARKIATIRIHNLRLRTLIGFNPDERVKKQDIVINAEIAYTLEDGVFDDHVEDALNYKTITKAIIKLVEDGQFLLLEKLVGEVLDICSADSSVQRASVTIEKPHALRFADSVSLTLEHIAPHAAKPRLLEKAS
ncbi:MAG: dihydroneopterin triphosphate 2'-epimerase [Pseudomonadota bacterium]